MKYILALILFFTVFILSYIIFLPYLIMSLRFKDHYEATYDACSDLANWVEY